MVANDTSSFFKSGMLIGAPSAVCPHRSRAGFKVFFEMSLDLELEPKARSLENNGFCDNEPENCQFYRFEAKKAPCLLRTV